MSDLNHVRGRTSATGQSEKSARPKRAKRESLVRPTQFPYPRGSSCDLRFSRGGRRLAEAMRAYAKPRLLPKLQARTSFSPECNRYDDLSVEFMDACVYLHAWLGHGTIVGIAEFPFARLYPVAGGLYNVSIRRLTDWSTIEDYPIRVACDLFWNQAPRAKFWFKVAEHKTFEESIALLLEDPNF